MEANERPNVSATLEISVNGKKVERISLVSRADDLLPGLDLSDPENRNHLVHSVCCAICDKYQRSLYRPDCRGCTQG